MLEFVLICDLLSSINRAEVVRTAVPPAAAPLVPAFCAPHDTRMTSIHCVPLPARFHTALLQLAEERWGWGVAAHGPYGAQLPASLPLGGWHNTSDYALEPLFHARAQRSHEPDAAAATAVFAPYYAGLALRLLGPAGAAALEDELLDTLANSSAWAQARPARRLLVIGLVANEFAQPREVC